MRIDSRRLTGLPVVTESGDMVGKVLSFDVDVETHAVLAYHVGRGGWSRAETGIVSPAQVVSVTAERMTVRDGAVRSEEGERAAVAAPVPGITPIATRQE